MKRPEDYACITRPKITHAQADEIRVLVQQRYELGKLERARHGLTLQGIADRYGISVSLIRLITLGKRHKPAPGVAGRPLLLKVVPENVCSTCHEAYWWGTDRIYGATLEHCGCGTKTLSRGWAA